MSSRRDFGRIVVGNLLAADQLTASAQETAAPDFDALLRSAEERPLLLEATTRVREGMMDFYAQGTRAGTAVKRAKSSRAISPKAIKLLVLFEVSSESRYEERYRRPLWPGGASGVTIGIGYDLGYQTATWFDEDWALLGEPVRKLLREACGKRGEAAGKLVPRCCVPCDHVPVRSWPLFRARELMRDVIEVFEREQYA